MSDKLFDDDLADLLGDNSSTKQTKSRRGDFLGALKRNKTNFIADYPKENISEPHVLKESSQVIKIINKFPFLKGKYQHISILRR